MKLIKLFLLRCICSKLKASCQQLINKIKMKFTELFLLTQSSKLKAQSQLDAQSWCLRKCSLQCARQNSPLWLLGEQIDPITFLLGKHVLTKMNQFPENLRTPHSFVWGKLEQLKYQIKSALYDICLSSPSPKVSFLLQFHLIFKARFVAICVFVWGKF